MTLPTRNRAWPPQELEPVLQRIDAWSAWYAGEPDMLQAALGGGSGGTGYNPFGEKIPKSRAGLVNRVAGWFWSQPKPDSAKGDVQLHIPVAADISSMSADLLFGEPPKLVLPDTAGTLTGDQLELYVQDGLFTDVREAAEIQSALGGTYLRVVWDESLADRPWLQAVHPDIAVPEFKFGRLAAVTFWTELDTDATGLSIRHLERHEPGAILHGLYEGTRTDLGRLIPLTEYQETADLVNQPDWDPSISGIPTGIDRLTVVYVPNVRPNRIWRNIPEATYFGRSDYQGIEAPMDRFDMVWSSWMRDIRLGLARLVVPTSALQNFGPGQGAYFDLDKELLVGLDLTMGPDEAQIKEVQFDIRTEAHSRTADKLLEQIVRGAGYSMQTFSGESQGEAITATEVTAKERRTLTTRDRKIGYWTAGLSQALEALLAIDIEKFGVTGVNAVRPQVLFPAAVSDPPDTTARTLQMLDAARAVSLRTKIAMAHPDWTKTQVEEEAVAIGNETPPPAPPSLPSVPIGVNGI